MVWGFLVEIRVEHVAKLLFKVINLPEMEQRRCSSDQAQEFQFGKLVVSGAVGGFICHETAPLGTALTCCSPGSVLMNSKRRPGRRQKLLAVWGCTGISLSFGFSQSQSEALLSENGFVQYHAGGNILLLLGEGGRQRNIKRLVWETMVQLAASYRNYRYGANGDAR